MSYEKVRDFFQSFELVESITPKGRPITWEDWLKGRRARRETGNRVAPEIIRRPTSSSDHRLRKLFNGERVFKGDMESETVYRPVQLKQLPPWLAAVRWSPYLGDVLGCGVLLHLVVRIPHCSIEADIVRFVDVTPDKFFDQVDG
jgi:hypothetical protein